MLKKHRNQLENNEPKVYVLHENDEWIAPLEQAFQKQEVPYEFWFINNGQLNLSDIPPEGVFYNRMSASSHTRDHRFAIELSEPILAWLQRHNRRTINGRNALGLEVRKTEQYLGMQQFGIQTPDTIVTNNQHDLIQAAKNFDHTPFLVKPNRGGKGSGVELFHSASELEKELNKNSSKFQSLDGLILLQEYVKPADGNIIRMEFIGGKFFYAVQVDASGGFELCPADQCNDEDNDQFCPADSKSAGFKILKDYHDPNIPLYEKFLQANGIEVGAIEYVEDQLGNRYVFDLNINTNYNSGAEKNAGEEYRGMEQIASFLKKELDFISQNKAAEIKVE